MYPTVIKELIFRRCNRLIEEIAALEPNTPERRKLNDEYAAHLLIANEIQTSHDQMINDIIRQWQGIGYRPIWSTLTEMSIPPYDKALHMVVDGEMKVITRADVEAWILEELSREVS